MALKHVVQAYPRDLLRRPETPGNLVQQLPGVDVAALDVDRRTLTRRALASLGDRRLGHPHLQPPTPRRLTHRRHQRVVCRAVGRRPHDQPVRHVPRRSDPPRAPNPRPDRIQVTYLVDDAVVVAQGADVPAESMLLGRAGVAGAGRDLAHGGASRSGRRSPRRRVRW
ncbi:hypothetical protein GCM10025864_05030 [Luteimicrobium album]|uniref:Uncharacterized protein n=1 Tax=Luteimicrobium album TaxID=1054550 RepID=A0ABQ6HZ14_9MICO|nr:hypothetical protein [Luteimicrobium album]GMA22744.1 hypothetical protein GCM10025864_05030 [Luteimicrobium album]